ncbi:SUMF1/EgtB/PvdO family nonheme iron enzyme, partial [Streptomyces cuspidosporus]
MGSDLADYPEEGPVREVAVDGFWIDETPVTTVQFRRFVKQTGYRTVAERAPDPADYPDLDPALLVPGSLVFTPTRGPV